jgi:hypothetical protein
MDDSLAVMMVSSNKEEDAKHSNIKTSIYKLLSPYI